MPQHVIAQTVSAAGQVFQTSATVADDVELNVDATLAASTVNTGVIVSLIRANVKSILIQSVGGDLTIKTNSTGSPADTVVMTAGQLILWSTVAVVGANPFPTADVTELYLSSTAGTKFSLRSILHQ